MFTEDQVAGAIEEVRAKSIGRTRYAGCTPYNDEILLYEIERLNSVISETRSKINAAGAFLELAIVSLGKHEDEIGRVLNRQFDEKNKIDLLHLLDKMDEHINKELKRIKLDAES